MFCCIRNALNENAQGIVEYTLVLAFVVAIGWVVLGSGAGDGIGSAIQNIFGSGEDLVQTAGENVQGQ